jgi:hypothetical protein
MSDVNDWQEIPTGQVNDWKEVPTNQASPQLEQLRQQLKIGNPLVDKSVDQYTPDQLENIQTQYQMGQSPVQMAGGEGIMKLLGKIPGKVGDFLMKSSIGAAKEAPGFGKALADQGLIGTKSMMAKQAEQGLQTSGQAIGDLASKIPGTISQAPVADQIGSLAGKRMTTSGIIPPEDVKDVGQILGKAREVSQSAPVSGSDMAELRAMAGRRARQMGAYRQVPSAQLKSQLAGAEQAGRSQALKDAYSSAFPGDESLANADKTYSTLATAKGYLSKPESDLIDAVKKSSVTGQLYNLIPDSLLQSVGGRAAIGTSNLMSKPAAAQIPLTLEQLLGKDSK